MKNFLLLLITIAISFSAQSQNRIVKYTFNQFSGDTVFDESGNGNNAILFGGAYIYGCSGNAFHIGLMIAGNTDSDFMSVPPQVLNGLQDFEIRIKSCFRHLNTGSPSSVNTIFSSSNSSCIDCFGLSYKGVDNTWKFSFNGIDYSFPGYAVFYGETIIERSAGVVSVFTDGNLIGTINDNTPLNITSIIIAQKEHCLGGCFQNKQALNGDISDFKVWDGIVLKESLPKDSAGILDVYPNPFSSTTTISFSLQQNSPTTIELLDVAGRKIKTLHDENLAEGDHEVNFNRESLTAGIYFVQLKTDEGVVTKKIVLE